jgi:hypothetical protein
MGISRESFGQIRDILRKLDNSIDSAREKRLKENEHRHSNGAETNGAPSNGADANGASSANGFERRAG